MTLPALLALLQLATAALGSPQAPSARAPGDSMPGARLRVFLLTFDPGPAVWERFGHNAIWVHDPDAGTEWAYDYGRFSFGNHFFFKFAIGDLRYSMGRADARGIVAYYQRVGRQVWLQELDLTAAAKAEMQRFFEWNWQPENREYDYNYYLDNCSTRLRDAIDRAVKGQLRHFGDSVATAMTYRDQTRRTTENNLAVYAALMLGLGEPVDHPLTAWEAMFLPIELRPYLDRVTVRDPDGREHPLVREERLLAPSTRFAVAAVPTPFTRRFLMIGLAVGLAGFGAGRWGRRSRAGARVFAGFAIGWSWVAGIGGLMLAGLWGLTAHRFSYWNENVLQLNVVSLALAVILPRALRNPAAGMGAAGRLAWIVAGLSLLGLGLKALPAFPQNNLDMIGLIAPIHLGLLAGLSAARRPAAGSLTSPGAA